MTEEWFTRVAYDILGHKETAQATYDVAMLALQRGIPGDFVECGVFKGGQCALMARAIMDDAQWPEGWTDPGSWLRGESFTRAAPRRVHLFDSFEGLPAATAIDEEIWAHHQDKTGEAAYSLSGVREKMDGWGIPPELLVYHPGWFHETIPAWAGEPGTVNPWAIAVLRLDGDLYSSTSVCMKYLYPLVSVGGWVIVDDYHLTGCKKAVHEVHNPGPIYWRKTP